MTWWALASALLGGLAAGAGLMWLRIRLDQASLRAQARRVLEEAEVTRERRLRDAELDAKEAALGLQKDLEQELDQRRDELAALERRIRARESKLDDKVGELERRERQVRQREEDVGRELDRHRAERRRLDEQANDVHARLERAAGLSQQEAKEELFRGVEVRVREQVAERALRLEAEARRDATGRANRIVAGAMQRLAGEYVSTAAVSVVQLPSDDMKGRIIGREGRNIRAIETCTGVDVIIDDTPEVVVVSSFNPLRRAVAKLAIETLVKDGRIHPARVEEVVEAARQDMDAKVLEAGERAALELGLHGVHVELLRLVGLLDLRQVGGQNMRAHAVETATLAGLMAAELGLSEPVARRAGLLHDVGKAADQQLDGHHAHVGAELCRRYGERPEVVDAVHHYHDDEPPTLYGVLVQAADRLSRDRPGVRKEAMGAYIERLEHLESLSRGFAGVLQAFALQSGREIRVMVSVEEVQEGEMLLLARDIAKRVEGELTYPGEVRVTVVREARVTEIAQ